MGVRSVSGERFDLPLNVQAALLRICQESLTNVIRHSRATEVRVSLAYCADSVYLGVQDNGIGFDLGSVKARGREGGFGLASMEPRARQLGGTFSVNSQNGGGTLVEVTIPTR